MKYGKKLLFLPIILLAVVLFAFSFMPALAQTNNNYDVTVSPVFFDLSTNPGTTVSDKIRIRNNTTSPLPIKLEVKRLTGDENGNLTMREDNSDNSLSWVKFSNKTFVAKPLEWTYVPFQINVPNDAAYGYYYTINFTHDNNSSLTSSGAKITGAAAVPILLNVRKEGAKAESKILKFSAGSYINEYLPVDFTTIIENTGNIHIRPRGNIFITNGGNKPISTLDVNENLSNIIPQTRKQFTSSWVDGFIVREKVMEDGQVKLDKNDKPVEKLTIYWNKLTNFRIGRYSANLLMVYDNGKRDVPLEASVSFWVIPYKVIITVFVSLIVIILLARFLIKFYVNKEIRKRSKRS